MSIDFPLFVAIGFAAQLIDGAIGMAYGLISTTVLLALGVTPPVASASVHAAEVVTTGVSALSHWRFGNINLRLFKRLAAGGVVGGALGAYLLVSAPAGIIRPLVSTYLLVMGSVVLWRSWRASRQPAREPKQIGLLGLTGGFLDAVGGGGWGSLVASTLVGRGADTRQAVGSTNAAEFLVALTVSATFVATIGLELWPIILGLIVGGVLAAPFAAYMTSRLPDRILMTLVGVTIMLLSLRELLQLWIG
jgi:uncharacterized membrane protein YfcA